MLCRLVGLKLDLKNLIQAIWGDPILVNTRWMGVGGRVMTYQEKNLNKDLYGLYEIYIQVNYLFVIPSKSLMAQYQAIISGQVF